MSSLASASLISLTLALSNPASLSLSLLPKVGARLAKLPLLDLAPSPPRFFPSALSVLSLANFLATLLCTFLKSEGRSVPP